MKIIVKVDGIYGAASGPACVGLEHGNVEVFLTDGRHLQAMIGRSSYADDCYFADCYVGAAALCSFSINLDMPFEQAATFIAGYMVREAQRQETVTHWNQIFQLTHGHTPQRAW